MEFEKYSRYFFHLFSDLGLSDGVALFLNIALNLLCVLVVAYFFSKLLRIVVVKIFKVVFSRFETQFDDFFIKNRVFIKLTNLVMLFIVKGFVPFIFADFSDYINNILVFLNVLILLAIILIIRGFFQAMNSYLKTLESFKDKPVDSYVQVVMLFVWLFGFILIFSLLTGETPWQFLTALGAISAVILLIFKDTILGLVASIQISVNDTVRIGDWVTMQKFDADGTVIEINLSSVMVRNFDNTITSIPTYYLNQESFKNWRGMQDLGARRIKRSLLIKTSSIKFLSEEEINKIGKFNLLKEHVSEWMKEKTSQKVSSENMERIPVNEKNLTNLGVFRKYINFYLKQHPDLEKEMITFSRLLEPTSQGIPLEIYAFSKETGIEAYENIAGDIVEHLLAAVSYFYLETYELPSDKSFLTDDSKSEEN